jgi:putative peptidoglycan lipid II flippase
VTERAGEARDTSLARNSMSVARWTLLSRVTGFARAAAVAAVLGPTYLGNTFQAANTLPNITFELLTGSLLASLLVPALVSHVDARRTQDVERVAGGFLGVAIGGFLLVAVAGVVAGPLILGLLTSTVDDPGVAEAQQRVGLILLALLMPQVILYGIAGIGAAVMNAHGRFALAAFAPTMENVGIMATMALYVAVYGLGGDVESIGTPQLVLLGVGTTAAVGLHAAMQWWGAHRSGVRLVPRAGWRDPEVRVLIRRTIPSMGYSGLNALRVFAVLIPANAVAGGVVAFSLAMNFLHLPTALGARPVATALLPRLSRLHISGQLVRFRDEFVHGLGLVSFFLVPAATVYLLLAEPLARAASYGELATTRGVGLVAAAVAGLALGALVEGVFALATYASYARQDTRTPFEAMVLRTIVSLIGTGIALFVSEGEATMLALGLAISAGNLASVGWLLHRLLRSMPAGKERFVPPLARAVVASAAMALPAWLVTQALSKGGGGDLTAIAAMALATALGAVAFFGAQLAMRSPELRFVRSGRSREPDVGTS